MGFSFVSGGIDMKTSITPDEISVITATFAELVSLVEADMSSPELVQTIASRMKDDKMMALSVIVAAIECIQPGRTDR